MAETTGKTTGKVISPGTDGDKFRFNLATWIVIFTFGGISILGLCAILMAAIPSIIYVFQGNGTADAIEEGFSNIKDILGILLPVMSAWAGTVIAFYFSKDNFESASKSTAALVQQLTPDERLRSILVKDVMIKMDGVDKLILEKDAKDIKIKTDMIDKILESKKRQRLPILDKEGRIKYMAHRSLFDKFTSQKAAEGKKVQELTLADMLADKNFEHVLTKSYTTLPETANLCEAKTLIEKIDICSDVFVTEDGNQTSKVVGWITDVVVREKATV